MAAEGKFMQPIVRAVWEGLLVHCYLKCGHLITMPKEDLGESSTSIKCWACEAETESKK